MRKKILIGLIILTIMLSSCSNKDKNSIVDTNVYQGTNGLVLEFVQNAPPREVFENQEFQIVGKITNKGTSTVENGVLKIAIEPEYMEISETDAEKAIKKLEGKTPYSPIEKIEPFTFNLKTKSIESLSQKHDSNIIISACYDYETKLVTSICIDPETYNIKPVEKICKQTQLSFSSQGAPIAITNIEQKNLIKDDTVKPQFIIQISNVGGGQIMSYGKAEEACSGATLGVNEINNLTISELTFSDYTLDQFDCEPKTLSFSEQGQNRFVCTMKDGVSDIKTSSSGYYTDLNVKLKYGYITTETKTVSIVRVSSR